MSQRRSNSNDNIHDVPKAHICIIKKNFILSFKIVKDPPVITFHRNYHIMWIHMCCWEHISIFMTLLYQPWVGPFQRTRIVCNAENYIQHLPNIGKRKLCTTKICASKNRFPYSVDLSHTRLSCHLTFDYRLGRAVWAFKCSRETSDFAKYFTALVYSDVG